MEDAPELLNDLLQKRRENQVEAQPGVSYPAAVKGRLRQREPGVSVLGPEGPQLHLGWRHVLLGGCLSPRMWRWWNLEVLLPLEGAPVTVPATSPGDVLLSRGFFIIVVIAWLHVLCCHQCEGCE